ncbi:MAG: PspA/IM30 family protein [Myxococcota bacterium]
MKLFDRLTTLLRADVHGVLEQLEEDSLLAKQHLRDAEVELDRKRAQLDAWERERRQLAEHAERCEAEVERLDSDVEIALEGDKEELARFSLKKLLPERRASEQARRRIEEIDTEHARLVETVVEQERRLEALRGEVLRRLRDPQTPLTPPARADAADEEVELELLRRRSARSEAR